MTPSALRCCSLGILLSLSGCFGGLLGGGKPDQLYRFGMPDAGGLITGPPEAHARTLVMHAPIFPPEVSADRMLTSQGRELAYLKDARWATATPAMYRMAAAASIRSRTAIIVVDGPQTRSADGELRIVIDRFEAAYAADPTGPPTVHVEGRASLSISREAPPLIHRVTGERRASANTAGAVAAAFDAAAAQSTTDLADWIAATLPRRPIDVAAPR